MIVPVSVKYLNDYKLFITFDNGEAKIYDVKPLLKYKVYEKLKNKGYFSLAKINYGTVVWPGNIDIAPELLYEDSITEVDKLS